MQVNIPYMEHLGIIKPSPEQNKHDHYLVGNSYI